MIGGATFLALLVAGQMVAALAIDHYGWLGFPVRPARRLARSAAPSSSSRDGPPRAGQ